MSRFTAVVHRLLQGVQRHTVRRDYLREMRFQAAFRKTGLREQEEYSHQQAVAYVNRMAEASPGFRAKLAAAGVTLPLGEAVEEWGRLPLISKSDYQRDPDAWLNQSVDPATLSWGFTSGSTGEPLRFPEDEMLRTAEYACNELNLLSVGWVPGDQEAIIKVSVPPARGLHKLARKLLGNEPVTFSAVKLLPEDTPRVVDALNRAGVRYLRSFPTVLLLVAEEMLRRGLRCHVPLIMVFGEGLSRGRAAVIEQAFNARVVRDYGGSEAMHIGFECPACGCYHLDLSRFKVEVLDEGRPVKPGESGEIVVTYFRNNALPFVRYRMGDLGTPADPAEPCPTGNPAPRLREIHGRIIDVIFAPNGRKLDAAYLVVVMEYVHEHVMAYKFIQTEADLIEGQFVPRHADAERHLADAERQIRDYTNEGFRVCWRAVPELPIDPNGKRRILVPLTSQWKTSVE